MNPNKQWMCADDKRTLQTGEACGALKGEDQYGRPVLCGKTTPTPGDVKAMEDALAKAHAELKRLNDELARASKRAA